MKRYIYVIIAAIVLASCSTTKRVQKAQKQETDPQKQLLEQVISVQPQFKSLQSNKVRFKIDYQQHSYSVSGSVSMIQDSAIILSLQPLMGIELYRMEIMPQHVTVIDKMNRRYVRMTYEQLQRQTGVNAGFDEIQAICMDRVFMAGVKQAELAGKNPKVVTTETEHNIGFEDETLSYNFKVDKNNLQLNETAIMPKGGTDRASVSYMNHGIYNNVVYPNSVKIEFASSNLSATCIISFTQLNINGEVNVAPQNLKKYTATTLSNIIK